MNIQPIIKTWERRMAFMKSCQLKALEEKHYATAETWTEKMAVLRMCKNELIDEFIKQAKHEQMNSLKKSA